MTRLPDRNDNLLKDLENFYIKLGGHSVTRNIEDGIDLDSLLTDEDRESRLKTIIRFFAPVQHRIWNAYKVDETKDCGKVNWAMFHKLSLVELLYIGLQAAAEPRQNQISQEIETLGEIPVVHSLIQQIQSQTMEALRKTLTPQMTSDSDQCEPKHIVFSVAFQNLCFARIEALKIEDCSECEVKYLEKCFANLPPDQDFEFEPRRILDRPPVLNHILIGGKRVIERIQKELDERLNIGGLKYSSS
eukprot:Gregarina_sp_Poly_1__3180@NODE_1901_length_3120_cov_57_141173_g1230_i0_p1_GENE_NODE_1901_length_3120_cov_57_141173_g1230_i0NODE_1901_length_3120_cov_57_141173_g1230_i0_p1_ORF_typecomplete_len246_score33_38DNTTIP1_dimer/PF18192_1/7_3e03DNTTIP1_dimer/PF18192_1/0_25_NODE_1901_length_3120_cov_57_141173_g1230_i014532190